MASLDHCLSALLWSETDRDGTPLDRLDAEPSEELLAILSADWQQFCDQAIALGFEPEEHRATMLHPDCGGDDWAAVAHDFILTRNHHGAGFWDGGWHQPWGDHLTALAHSFGPIECYVSDSVIYC